MDPIQQSVNTPPSVQSSPIEQESSHLLKNLIILSGIFLFIIGVGAIAYFLGQKTALQRVPTPQSSIAKTESQIPNWTKPNSSRRGYPIIGNVQKLPNDSSGRATYPLFIYSLDSKSLNQTNFLVYGDTSGEGIGSSLPAVSPNLFYTVFINHKGSSLTLLSNETQEGKTISPYADTIIGWTPDSKKIIYRVQDNNISTPVQGPGLGLTNNKVVFDMNIEPGFYIFDIETGESKKLYPLNNVFAVINDKLLLVKVAESEQQYYKKPIVFNIESFEADYGKITEDFVFGDDNFSFSSDGSRWTFLHSTDPNNPTNDSNVIYATFPNKQGKIIDSGKWADLQFPKMSPDGTKIAYSKKDGYFQPNQPKYAVWVYNTQTKQKTSYNVEGFPRWIDENTLVVESSDASKHEDSVYLLDLTSGVSTKLH